MALDIPRRLGDDATPHELTLDKKFSRKVITVYSELWAMHHRQMGAPPRPEWSDRNIILGDPLMARVAATVIWNQQVDYLIGVVHRREAMFVELEDMARIDKMGKWYNRYTAMLDWELDALYKVRESMDEEAERIEAKFLSMMASRGFKNWQNGRPQ
jgi:hypothetical protein